MLEISGRARTHGRAERDSEELEKGYDYSHIKSQLQAQN